MLSDNGEDISDEATCVRCTKFSSHVCETCGDFYCSRICQKLDWRSHRYICKIMPALVLKSVFDNQMMEVGHPLQEMPALVRPNGVGHTEDNYYKFVQSNTDGARQSAKQQYTDNKLQQKQNNSVQERVGNSGLYVGSTSQQRGQENLQLRDAEGQHSNVGKQQYNYDGGQQQYNDGQKRSNYGGQQRYDGQKRNSHGGQKHNEQSVTKDSNRLSNGGQQQKQHGNYGKKGSQKHDCSEPEYNQAGQHDRSSGSLDDRNDNQQRNKQQRSAQRNDGRRSFDNNQQRNSDGHNQRGYSGQQQRSYDDQQLQQRNCDRQQERTYEGQQQRTYDGQQNRNYDGQEQRNYDGQQNSNYDGQEQRNYDGQKQRNYDGEEQRNYEGQKQRNYDGQQNRNYDGQQRNYDGEEQRNYEGQKQRNHDGQRQRNYDGQNQRSFDGQQRHNNGQQQRNHDGQPQQRNHDGQSQQRNHDGQSQQRNYNGQQRNHDGQQPQRNYNGQQERNKIVVDQNLNSDSRESTNDRYSGSEGYQRNNRKSQQDMPQTNRPDSQKGFNVSSPQHNIATQNNAKQNSTENKQINRNQNYQTEKYNENQQERSSNSNELSGQNVQQGGNAPVLDPPFEITKLDENANNFLGCVIDTSYIRDGMFACIPDKHYQAFINMQAYLTQMGKGGQPYKPVLNEYCIAMFEGEWYRAKVIGDYKTEFKVEYIDFTNKGFVKTEEIRHYPSNLTEINSTSMCKLAGLPENLNSKLINQLEKMIVDFQRLYISTVKKYDNYFLIECPVLLKQLSELGFI